MNRDTIFSADRRYRYTLWRTWVTEEMLDGSNEGERGEAKLRGYVQFVGLNPSTADETRDDQTIRKCMAYTERWGYGAMCMTNLFAWRDTEPADMKRASNPEGDFNDDHLLRVARDAGLVVACWGNHGRHRCRGVKVKQLFREAEIKLWCLRLTKSAQPEHPLYLPAILTPTHYC